MMAVINVERGHVDARSALGRKREAPIQLRIGASKWRCVVSPCLGDRGLPLQALNSGRWPVAFALPLRFWSKDTDLRDMRIMCENC